MPQIRLGCFERYRSIKEDPQSSVRFDDQGGISQVVWGFISWFLVISHVPSWKYFSQHWWRENLRRQEKHVQYRSITVRSMAKNQGSNSGTENLINQSNDCHQSLAGHQPNQSISPHHQPIPPFCPPLLHRGNLFVPLFVRLTTSRRARIRSMILRNDMVSNGMNQPLEARNVACWSCS